MNHEDHVRLIRDGVPAGGNWADLGSGRGAFTLALAECLGTDSKIYSVDVDQRSLDVQATRMAAEFPDNEVEFIKADFTHALKLPKLDGIVMANSLHFVREKQPVLKQLRELLKVDGRLVIVEYDTDKPISYVPYPFSYETWAELAQECGFVRTTKLATRPSSNMGQIYSALSFCGIE
jgi:ubiquinone/menaquinone biosynthesis C-methylase UbiE